MRTVAAHQPTFLPWLGWWDKLVRADVFVILDDVQIQKKGSTWLNRVPIDGRGARVWLTVPLDRTYHGVRTVREARIDDSKPWRIKLSKTLASAYGRAPFYDKVMPVLEEILHLPTAQLAALNETAIRLLADKLEVSTAAFVHQSELAANAHGTDLLVKLCKVVGGDVYLTGDGAGGYLEPEKFAAAGLRLEEQQFTSPVYAQPALPFVAGLSIVDALMSCGWEQTSEMLRKRPEPA